MTACLSFCDLICAYVPLCAHPAWRQRRCKAQTPMMHLFSLFCHVGAACVFVWLPRSSRLVASEARSRSLCLPLLQTSLALSFLFNSHWPLLFICFAPHSVAHWLQLPSLRCNRPLLMHYFLLLDPVFKRVKYFRLFFFFFCSLHSHIPCDVLLVCLFIVCPVVWSFACPSFFTSATGSDNYSFSFAHFDLTSNHFYRRDPNKHRSASISPCVVLFNSFPPTTIFVHLLSLSRNLIPIVLKYLIYKLINL